VKGLEGKVRQGRGQSVERMELQVGRIGGGGGGGGGGGRGGGRGGQSGEEEEPSKYEVRFCSASPPCRSLSHLQSQELRPLTHADSESPTRKGRGSEKEKEEEEEEEEEDRKKENHLKFHLI